MIGARPDIRRSIRSFFTVLLAAVTVALLCHGSAWAVPGDSGTKAAPDRRAETGRRILDAVVGVRTLVPGHARTARSLGTERQGTGIVIDDAGLVVTIGYLILEAEKASLLLKDGTERPAAPVAYDHKTGLGLLRALAPLGIKPAVIGSAADLKEGAGVVSIAMGGDSPITPAQVVSRRDFAGYWEYLMENAIFTSPPNPFFGGAPLFDLDGKLVGIGSLVVADSLGPNEILPGNMFIPIDALKPALDAMVKTGRGPGPRMPWLGLHTAESHGRLFVIRVAEDGPAARAGIKPGDVIFGAGGRHVSNMAEFYRRVWSMGGPGADITIDLVPQGSAEPEIRQVKVRAVDRYDWLKLNH